MAQPSNPADQPVSAQVCLVDGEARAWVMDKLVGFIEETRPDYLKWDNNLWVNCTRTGHGHGLEDGNFTHHRALQTVLDELRDRFPTLDIENCASGGNRLSLDMLARTDSAWMDDRTDIGSRVRHEVQGLLALLPTPYLLSFAVGTQETFDDNHVAEMPYVLRSRMLGVPGISWVLRAMADDTLDGTAREMAMYKRLRPFQQYGATLLLSGQVQPPAAGAWDAVEFLMPGAADAAVMAYNAPDAPEIARLRLRGLQPDAFYTVESADAGVLGVATGRDLMDRGVELSTASAALGHMLFLHAE
jgi:alpha-galactosidase